MSTPTFGHDTIDRVNEHPAFATAIPLLAAEAVQQTLLGEPAAAVATRLTEGDAELATALRREGASFVTLQRDGRLRGCIGSLIARRPLYQDVALNARKATRDPRSAPIDSREWPDLSIAVSVLTPPVPLEFDGPAALITALRPGVDGLTLRDGSRRATFLRSVWASLENPRDFLAALLRKGDWTVDAWPETMTAETYQTVFYPSLPPRPALETM